MNINTANKAFQDLDPDLFSRLLTDRAAEELINKLHQSKVGNCLRVSTLPLPVMQKLALRLYENMQNTAHICFLIKDNQDKRSPWEVKSTQLVALRNAEDRSLLVFVPPGIHTSAEDSFDVSTFAELDFSKLSRTLCKVELDKLPINLRPQVERLIERVRFHGLRPTDDQVLKYLLTVLQNGATIDVAGRALYQLGLIPDLAVFDDNDGGTEYLDTRIKLNAQARHTFVEASETLLTRIYHLKLERGTFQARLYNFLKDYTPEDITHWGRVIATDEFSQQLTFDHWPFVKAQQECLLYVQDLKLPLRQDAEGSIKIFNPYTTKSLSVTWETEPDFKDVSTLDHFRLEIVNSAGSVMYESGRIGVKKGANRRMSYSMKTLSEVGLQEDLYFLRVRAYTADGILLNKEDREDSAIRRDPNNYESKRINETEEFLYLEDNNSTVDNPEMARNQMVASYLEARLSVIERLLNTKGRGEVSGRLKGLKPEKAAWISATTFAIRYSAQYSYCLSFSSILANAERRTLAFEDSLGRWSINLLEAGALSSRTTQRDASGVPSAFLASRQQLFATISAIEEKETDAVDNSSAPAAGMLISTIDLIPLASKIEEYIISYQNWLDLLLKELTQVPTMDTQAALLRKIQLALDIDVVQLTVLQGVDHKIETRLLAPTHPLRLWWHLQCQQVTDTWLDKALDTDNPKNIFIAPGDFLRLLTPRYIPQVLLDDNHQFYVDSGALTPFWQLYLPSDTRDSRSIGANLAKQLGLQQSWVPGDSISVYELTGKIKRYLIQHPYVSTLKLNVFNPGDARLIADTLIELQKERADLRYQIQLFHESGELDDIGSALEDLINPNRQVSEMQDEFTQASRNLLFPKLRFARNRLGDFKDHPELFSAHLSLLLNLFPAHVSLDLKIEKGRSSYIYGLIQEPVTTFTDNEGQLVWCHQVKPGRTKELSASSNATLQLAHLLDQYATLQADISSGDVHTLFRPTVQLILDLDAKSLLYQIHASSDWVLMVDSNLGLEYFDSTPDYEHPTFVIDFTPEYLAATGEHLILTTQAVDELINIIGPILERYGINEGDGQAMLFFHALRSLSGQLTLKLMADPNHADEAISLALTRLFLEQLGLLENRLVIPLDNHIDLFQNAPEASGLSMRRSDLLMVEADPDSRTLVFHLLEVKSRRHGINAGLEDDMESQLANAEKVLQAHFDPHKSLQDVKIKELMQLLDFYLKRACRYGSIKSEIAAQMLEFFTSLDSGYSLQFVRRGLIFDLSFDMLKQTVRATGTTFHTIGTEHISRLVQQGLRALNLASIHAVQPEDGLAILPAPDVALIGDTNLVRLRDAFTTTAFGARIVGCEPDATHDHDIGDQAGSASEKSLNPEMQEQGTPSHPAPLEQHTISEYESAETLSAKQQGTSERQESAIGPNSASTLEEAGPFIDVLIGDTRMTSQYGILGIGSGRIVGLDLNGVNTISLFGVQGAGKSYTIGNIVEMATQQFPGVNHLPHPLATVIFHYHESQNYVPEFVSMVKPNNRADEVSRLRAEFGAEPAALADVLMLTSSDKVATRKMDYPNVEVRPISFRSNELTARDWQFLMGVVDNSSLYITHMNKIMRDYRGNLTLDNIRNGVASSRLNDSQKSLAEMRLEFASEYIADTAPLLADHLKAGRLVIVDFRDELIQKDQALGLFVVMLSIFASVGTQNGQHMNKLIVWDEAHKYLTGGELTDQVVSVIRQMRHQGVSIVIASQDPVSLPSAVIELSSIIILHRFNSPNWLKHIQKSLVALNELTVAQLALLKPGEAYIWANKATEPIYSQKALKIRLRPRVTLHGGTTKTSD